MYTSWPRPNLTLLHNILIPHAIHANALTNIATQLPQEMIFLTDAL